MSNKIDLQARLNALVAEIHEIKSSINVPMILMRNPPARCSAIEIVPFNDREMISIKALIAWAALENKLAENVVEAWLAEWADVATIDEIARERYDEVIRFLVDFQTQVN